MHNYPRIYNYKLLKYVSLFVFVLLVPSVLVSAQYIDNGAIRDQIIQNMILEQRVRIFIESEQGTKGTRASKTDLIKQTGAARIKAGKANLTFVPNANVTEQYAKGLQWAPDEPQDLPGQVKYVQRQVRLFNQLAAQNGYKPHDFVDGYVFAYALAHAAYYNKDLDSATVKEMRQERQTSLLVSAYFQGLSDSARQAIYENSAVMIMQAAEWRAKYRQAKSEAERQQYDQKAKFFANTLLGIDK